MRDKQASLLDRFADSRRTVPAQAFFRTIRFGAKAPADVLMIVKHDLRDRCRMPWTTTEQRGEYEQIISVIDAHRDEALEFAAACIRREQAPPEERQRLRWMAATEGKRRWQETQQPTEAQRAYLRVLGWEGEVGNRREASELIDRLRRGGAR